MEGTVGVLEPSVTMEQRRCSGIGRCRQIKGVKYQRIIVPVSDYIGDDPAVVQVEDGAEVDLMDLNPFIPLELRHVCQPLLVGLFRVEVSVQKVLSNVLRAFSLPSTAVVGILNRGLDSALPANTEYALVIDRNPMEDLQIIPEPPVAFLRLIHVHLLQFLGDLLVFLLPGRKIAAVPLVIGRSGNV